MEERHDEQRRRLQTGFGLRAAGCPRIACATPMTMMFCTFAIAWRCETVAPLGFPGRARRVEDREDVVLVDRRHRGMPGSPGSVDELRERARIRRVARGAVDDEDVLERRAAIEAVAHARARRRASAISTFALRVTEPELELLGLPPRVQRHERRAEDRARPPRDDPFGHVRRDERDAVAALRRRAPPASAPARARRRSCSPKVRRRSCCTTQSTSARAAFCAISSRSDLMRCL